MKTTTTTEKLIESYLDNVDITWQGIILEGRDQAREFLTNFINFIKE